MIWKTCRWQSIRYGCLSVLVLPRVSYQSVDKSAVGPKTAGEATRKQNQKQKMATRCSVGARIRAVSAKRIQCVEAVHRGELGARGVDDAGRPVI